MIWYDNIYDMVERNYTALVLGSDLPRDEIANKVYRELKLSMCMHRSTFDAMVRDIELGIEELN